VIFSTVRAANQHVAVAELEDLLSTYRKKQFTGAVEIAFPGEESLSLLLANGAVVDAVHHQNGEEERITDSAVIQRLVNSPEAEISAMRLLSQMIVPGRIMAALEPTQTLQTSTNEIPRLILEWSKLASLSLVHIHWMDAEAILLLPGEGLPARDIALVTPDAIQDSPEALDTIKRWDQPDCVVQRWEVIEQNDLWSQVQIRLAFSTYVHNILIRYEQFTGRALVNVVARDVNILSARNGWNINMTGTSIIDNTVFSSTDHVIASYRSMMTAIMQHIISVVGRKLMEMILLESAMDLAPSYCHILEKHMLLPESVIPHVRGKEVASA
jgi:hypothetical protein